MSVKRQREDEAGADGEFLSQPDFQGSKLSQNAVAMVGADSLATDPTSLRVWTVQNSNNSHGPYCSSANLEVKQRGGRRGQEPGRQVARGPRWGWQWSR